MGRRDWLGIVVWLCGVNACGAEEPDEPNGASTTTDADESTNVETMTPDGLVISHLEDGNTCTEWFGREKVNTFLPSTLGPCPPRRGVLCAKCEDEYPTVTFTIDGIRSRNEYFARASEQACVDWAEGSRRADECEIEWRGKFTALAPGVGGRSSLTIPELVPGTLTEGLGPWQFSLVQFRVESGAVKLTDCTNYYGTAVSDDARWRGETVPCADEGRIRTAPAPFLIEGVTAERVFYED